MGVRDHMAARPTLDHGCLHDSVPELPNLGALTCRAGVRVPSTSNRQRMRSFLRAPSTATAIAAAPRAKRCRRSGRRGRARQRSGGAGAGPGRGQCAARGGAAAIGPPLRERGLRRRKRTLRAPRMKGRGNRRDQSSDPTETGTGGERGGTGR